MKIKTLSIICLLALQTANAANLAETATEKYLASILDQPKKIQAFMSRMPKGGDLHNHSSGSTFAEKMMEYAVNDNLCVDRTSYTVFINNDCQFDDLLNNAIKNADFYDAIIDAWSMQHFQLGKESGHDHFFNAFGKFKEISHHHIGEILAEIVERAAEQNELYVETMISPDSNASGRLGQQLGWDDDFAAMRNKLLAHDFDKIIIGITTYLDASEKKMQDILGCTTAEAKPGCKIQLRYQYQILREQAPEMVFAQLLAGFETASKEQRIVGLNMVMPEDGVKSMHDYRLHMQMIAFLHELYPAVHISLHAGELNQEVATPEGLSFHINDAVNVAHAERIGHGVDIVQEENYTQLLQHMAEQRVMVEINLTSNAGILNIEGKDHPLPTYLQYGVPVALSTDDEGVTRSTITSEYARAVSTYQFKYSTIKDMVRNSLAYSFLPGTSLWQHNDYQRINNACRQDKPGAMTQTKPCKTFLASSQKAKLQWDLENRFNQFEMEFIA
jgi:adenosine deaminase